MKILQVIPSLDVALGGPARFAPNVARELIRAGHSVSIITMGSAEEISWMQGAADLSVVDVTTVGRRYSRFAWSPRLASALVEAARSADVVLIHGLWQWHVEAAYAAASKTGCPYLVMPHGMLDPWIIRRTRLRKAIRSAQLRHYERSLFRDAGAVLFNSEAERRKAATLSEAVGRRGRVIRYGTDDPSEAGIVPRTRRPPTERVRVGYLGRLHPKKNLESLIAASLRVASEQLTIEIVGPGATQAYADELERRAARAHAHRLHFSPPQFDDVRFRTVASWDWLILPSFQENFGQTLVEALSVGTPVLVSNTTDLASRLAELGVAITFDPTVDGIVGALDACALSSSTDMSTLSERCRAVYESEFSLRASAADLVSIAREVAAR